MTNAERQRCAIALSNIRPDTSIQSDHADSVGTPFTLFGARGRLMITAAKKPYLDWLAQAGCEWVVGVCQPITTPAFGIDPDDQSRGSLLAEFYLGGSFTLYAGAQEYMEIVFPLGPRPIITTGIRVTYRW